MLFPLLQEIPYQDPVELFAVFKDQPGSIFLDSALQQGELGRYSYIAAEPFKLLQPQEDENPFDTLALHLKKFSQATLPDLPLFQGGVAGYFGYELFRHLENIPLAAINDMQFPEMMLGFYDVVIAFDHQEKRGWIFSSGFPELESIQREKRAKERLAHFTNLMTCHKRHPHEGGDPSSKKVKSDLTKQVYCDSVQRVIDYILAGDIFQANFTQRFTTTLPENDDHYDLYQQLRTINPATFAAYLNFGKTKLVSASPERFIKLENFHVETRPIKGTRKRGKTAEEDQQISQALLVSPKDNAENVMIVDLLRNDLSRVCEPGSVTVPQLCGLETFATVHHLVSVVHGKLKPEYTAVDLLRATFPGGSITGAPKIRAMEIISELEPNQRGPYCGSIGYITWDGNMDTSITIRTICIQGNKASFQVGGGIVADSQPEDEYEESLIKGNALMQALAGLV